MAQVIKTVLHKVISMKSEFLKKVNKINRAERKDKAAGIDTSNIIVGGRRR